MPEMKRDFGRNSPSRRSRFVSFQSKIVGVRALVLAAALPVVLAACASAPEKEQLAYHQAAASTAPAKSAGDQAAGNAAKMLGKPYRYGGSSPSGFDCSGLVLHSYRHAGVALPRSTAEQRRISKHVKLAELRRGDLLFFDQEGKKNSHVGRLDNPYWKKHLSEARRIAA